MMHKIILLVDDDPDDQLIFTDALREITKDVQCSVVHNGQEAMSYLEKMPEPIVIFLDLNMPLMNGFEFLKQVKEDQQHNQIPVVIYTTSDHPRDKVETMANGAHLFFTKTPDFKMLKERLKEILSGLGYE